MMRLIITAACVVGLASAASAGRISLEQKVALQAAMFQHIEKSTIDGAIPFVKLDNGKVVSLTPSKAHPMILKLGKTFVLCTDFRDPKGKFVNVDLYMTEHDDRFVVFQSEIDNRGPLKKLVNSGKVRLLK